MKTLILYFLLFLSIQTSVYAQNAEKSVGFVQKFKSIQESLPRENIYLHTDRDTYFVNDNLWFSVYVTAGSYNFPSQLSQIVYVQLRTDKGEVVDNKIIKIVDGRGSGRITFSEKQLNPGFYTIHAFTSWSLNFANSYTFTKSIRLTTDTENNIDNEIAKEFDIQFFPEGGNLIANQNTVVAFKAIYENGKGKAVSGVIYDDNHTKVDSFNTEYLGMGSLNFTPKQNTNYYAVVENKRFTLPEVKSEGTSLQVTNNLDTNTFDVLISTTSVNSELLLFGHVRGQVYSASILKSTTGNRSIAIPKQNFPTGVVHFTLLNNGTPSAERLIFNRNKVDEISAAITLDKQNYRFRDKSTVSISLNNISGNEMFGSASISVYDSNISNYDSLSSNIVSKFLLESEISSPIENPAYYFNNTSTVGKHLDLLMLTQGWRVYDMEQISSKTEFIIDKSPEKGFEITGTIKSRFGRNPLSNASVMLVLGSGTVNSKFAITDENGRFGFDNLDFSGETLITIKAQHPKSGTNVHIDLDKIEEVNSEIRNLKIIRNPDNAEIIDSSNTKLITERNKNTQNFIDQFDDVQMSGELDEITVKAERESDNYIDLAFEELQGAGTKIDFDEHHYLQTLPIEIILSQIPGVTANKASNTIQVETGFKSFQSGELPPLLYLDGIQVDNRTVFSLNTAEIKSITVARSAADMAIFGSEGAGGAVIITSQRNKVIPKKSPGLITEFLNGYEEKATFYAPKYGINVPSDISEIDGRITLHWNPTLNINYGVGKDVFWLNDIQSTYRIVVQGITDEGLPFYISDEINLNPE